MGLDRFDRFTYIHIHNPISNIFPYIDIQPPLPGIPLPSSDTSLNGREWFIRLVYSFTLCMGVRFDFIELDFIGLE